MIILDIGRVDAIELIQYGIEEYLSKQEGIISLRIENIKDKKRFYIEYDSKLTNSQIIYKYITIFNKNKELFLEGFDKGIITGVSTCNYVVEDMCCEYCYRGFVGDLFKNDNINSVFSEFEEPNAFNVEFNIGYTCTKEELLLIIKDILVQGGLMKKDDESDN